MRRSYAGFTLLEMLIALFIWTILSMALAGVLHQAIHWQADVEVHAARLRALQLTLLLIARDIEQMVDRPVSGTISHEPSIFSGTPRSFSFTYTEWVNQDRAEGAGVLRRVHYAWHGNALIRSINHSLMHGRRLLTDVADAHFKYLNKDGQFLDEWPEKGRAESPLPRAIRLFLTISGWGTLSQLYVISTA